MLCTFIPEFEFTVFKFFLGFFFKILWRNLISSEEISCCYGSDCTTMVIKNVWNRNVRPAVKMDRDTLKAGVTLKFCHSCLRPLKEFTVALVIPGPKYFTVVESAQNRTSANGGDFLLYELISRFHCVGTLVASSLLTNLSRSCPTLWLPNYRQRFEYLLQSKYSDKCSSLGRGCGQWARPDQRGHARERPHCGRRQGSETQSSCSSCTAHSPMST